VKNVAKAPCIKIEKTHGEKAIMIAKRLKLDKILHSRIVRYTAPFTLQVMVNAIVK